MLISLRSDHREHLNLLLTQQPEVIVDFCKMAINYLRDGPAEKLYTTVADKLSVEMKVVQNCVMGLVYLLMVSCKHKLSTADYRDSILTLGFSNDQQVVLSKFYEAKKDEIHEILSKLSLRGTHYHNLDWRFDVQIASRSMPQQQVTPLITLDLSLKDEPIIEKQPNEKHILLQTDPIHLKVITEQLETALAESRSQKSRKLQRSLKQ